ARTLRLHRSLPVPCPGVDHLDFTADGRLLLASCEFASRLIVVDVRREQVLHTLPLPAGAVPQDVKLAPDGRVFYVADRVRGGVWIVGARSFHVLRLLPPGAGAHGLYPSRDARFLYVTDRAAGTIAVVSFRTRRVVRTWRVGGSPDMGGVTADGRTLWVSS